MGRELGGGGSSAEGKDYLRTILMKLGGGIILFLFLLDKSVDLLAGCGKIYGNAVGVWPRNHKCP